MRLQVLATQAANLVCNLIGIKMQAVGTTLIAVEDESFQFQVIGDCSGINSLMAITLMTAVFAHLTQDRLWKKLAAVHAASAPVAIVGNVARLTSIMLVAKCFGQHVGRSGSTRFPPTSSLSPLPSPRSASSTSSSTGTPRRPTIAASPVRRIQNLPICPPAAGR